MLRLYAANSTCHGVKLVSEADSKGTRCLWLISFLTALAFFSHQIYDRIHHYTQWPVDVDIEVAYNDTLLFPAVAICNSNQFKITKAVEMGLYDNLSAYFSGNPKKAITHLDKFDYQELLKKLATRKEDMIIDCKWGKRQCSSANFTEVLTDHGVCYVFNNPADDEDVLFAESTGANQGLQLMINTENYENMVGPQWTSGIKVLIFDQKDILRVQDLALSVASFTETRIGLQMSKVSNLPAPYGSCGDLRLRHHRHYTFDACKMEMMVEKTVSKCKCITHFMEWNGSPRPPTCNVSTLYGCARRIDDLVRGNMSHCIQPCEQRIHSTGVSYTELSPLIAHTVVGRLFSDGLTKARVWKAGLVRRMVRKDLVKEDNALFNEFIRQNSYESFQRTIRPIQEKAGPLSDEMTETLKPTGMLQDIKHKLKLESDRVLRYYDKDVFRLTFLRKLASQLVVSMKPVTAKLMKSIQHANGRTNSLSLLFTVCRSVNQLSQNDAAFTGIRSAFDSIYRRVSKQNFDWLSNVDVITPFDRLRISAATAVLMLQSTVQRVSCQIINNAMLEVSQMDNFVASVPFLDKEFESLHVALVSAVTIADEVVASRRVVFDELVEENEIMVTSVEETRRRIREFNKLTRTVPHLVSHRFNVCRELEAAYNESPSTIVEIVNANIEIPNERHLLRKFREMQQVVADNVQSFKASKKLLAQGVFRIASLAIELNETRTSPAVVDQLNTVVNKLHGLVTNLTDFEKEGEALKNYYEYYLVPFRKLRKAALDFRKSLALDESFVRDNILSVKVFYQSLSYSEIVKAEGYGWFALLSDIGGSAGLFVGASLLTILELTYFVATNFHSEEDTTQDGTEKGEGEKSCENTL